MSTSRRAFLRGAAALPVAVSTGGGSAVAGAAVSTASAGAGLAVALSAAERKARAAVALARHGRYFFDDIASILGKTSWSLNPDKVEQTKQAMGVLFNNGSPRRRETKLDKENTDFRYATEIDKGKIDFRYESNVFLAMHRLPRTVPIKDLMAKDLLKEIYDDGSDSASNHSRYNHDEGDIDTLLNQLAPFINDDTTIDDLEALGLSYFKKLAQHFLDHPKDFAGDFLSGDRIAHNLRYFMQIGGAERDGGSYQQLAEALQEKSLRYQKAHEIMARRNYLKSEKIQQQEREAINLEKQRQRLAEEKERQAEIDNRRQTPEARNRFKVNLVYGQSGEYIVEQQKAGRILRADWLQFVQEIDPQNAKPGDIELRAGGMMVAFKNTAVIQHLENAQKSTLGGIVISLPNRRMGVDLNDPPCYEI